MTDATRYRDRAVTWLLLSITGCAAATAYQALEFSNAVFSVMWLEWGWSESIANAVLAAGSWGCLAAAIAGWMPHAAGLLWFVSLWLLVVAAAHAHTDARYGWLVLGTAGIRWLAPAACALLRYGHETAATTVLRLGIALTFACHGMQALAGDPVFVDYIAAAATTFFDRTLEPSTIDSLLLGIGAVDLLVALLVVTTRARTVVVWMIVWALVTAASRVVHSGWSNWDQVLLRLPHAGGPVALLVLFAPRRDDDSPAS